ncbi:hypothetical protein VULLAG_LOCUS19506 [Vulpes lagopus]
MPRPRSRHRRERARRAGRRGSGRPEAPASAPPRLHAAGEQPGLRQPPPSPPPPPGGPGKSLDLGEDAALSQRTSGARRRPGDSPQIAD